MAGRFFRDLASRVRRGAVNRGERARVHRRFALLLVEIDDDRALASHGLEQGQRHEAKAAGAEDQDRLAKGELDLLQRAIGGDAGARIGSGRDRIEAGKVEEIARMRHEDMVGVAAIAMDAETARLEAQVFVPGAAHLANAATDPRVDETRLANRHALRLGAKGEHFTHRLVPHGKRQRHAPVLQRELPPSMAELIAALPDMQIAVANAGRPHLQEDLGAGWLRRRRIDPRERRRKFGDLEAPHPFLPQDGLQETSCRAGRRKGRIEGPRQGLRQSSRLRTHPACVITFTKQITRTDHSDGSLGRITWTDHLAIGQSCGPVTARKPVALRFASRGTPRMLMDTMPLNTFTVWPKKFLGLNRKGRCQKSS
jgi:hypothetical protein